MNWYKRAYPSLPQTALHGTCEDFAKKIRTNGFELSVSGGGQRGLKGVWLTSDYGIADTYASGWKYKKALPCVLIVKINPSLNIADLTHSNLSNPVDIMFADYKFLGLDIKNDDDLEIIRSLQPFALTKLLVKKGYDGAWISDTLGKTSIPELVIFDSKNLSIV